MDDVWGVGGWGPGGLTTFVVDCKQKMMLFVDDVAWMMCGGVGGGGANHVRC